MDRVTLLWFLRERQPFCNTAFLLPLFVGLLVFKTLSMVSRLPPQLSHSCPNALSSSWSFSRRTKNFFCTQLVAVLQVVQFFIFLVVCVRFTYCQSSVYSCRYRCPPSLSSSSPGSRSLLLFFLLFFLLLLLCS